MLILVPPHRWIGKNRDIIGDSTLIHITLPSHHIDRNSDGLGLVTGPCVFVDYTLVF